MQASKPITKIEALKILFLCLVPVVGKGAELADLVPQPAWVIVPGQKFADPYRELQNYPCASSFDAHESAHLVSSWLRWTFFKRGRAEYPFFGLQRRVVSIPCPPADVTIESYAKYVPVRLRGSLYGTYLLSQGVQGSFFNSDILYIEEESNCYQVSASWQAYLGDPTGIGALGYSLEFVGYDLTLTAVLAQPKYEGRYDLRPLQTFVDWSIATRLDLVEKAKAKGRDTKDQDAWLEEFRSGPEWMHTHVRRFCDPHVSKALLEGW